MPFFPSADQNCLKHFLRVSFKPGIVKMLLISKMISLFTHVSCNFCVITTCFYVHFYGHKSTHRLFTQVFSILPLNLFQHAERPFWIGVTVGQTKGSESKLAKVFLTLILLKRKSSALNCRLLHIKVISIYSRFERNID